MRNPPTAQAATRRIAARLSSAPERVPPRVDASAQAASRAGATGIFLVCGLLALLAMVGLAFSSAAREARDRAHKAYLGQVALDGCASAIDQAILDFSTRATTPPDEERKTHSLSEAISSLTTHESIQYALAPDVVFSPPDATLTLQPVRVQFQVLQGAGKPDPSSIDAPVLTPQQVDNVRKGMKEFFTSGM